MSDPHDETPAAAEPEELSDEELEDVSGGNIASMSQPYPGS